MKKQFDSGHETNVARFTEMIKRISEFGAKFNPARAIIKLDSMKSLQVRAIQSIAALNKAHTDMTRAITARARTFVALDKLVTRVNNAVASSDILPETIGKISNHVDKYRSKRINPIDEPQTNPTAETAVEEERRHNSVAQGSMNNKIKNFKKLITMVKAEENYLPNELDLTVESLETMLNEIITRNDLAQDGKIAFNTALEARNKILYDTELGLITTVRVAKKYTRSAFGPKSKQFKRLSKLVFTDIRKKE